MPLALPSGAGALQDCYDPCVGPSTGALVLAGGGELGPEIHQRFVELAGGSEARIVVIPTAGRGDVFPEDWHAFEPFWTAGARDVRVLHTRSREVADAEAFVGPLRTATGVWFLGGRPWRLIDAYGGTRVEDELHLLLARGGVVGGTSAGASIMASFLVRGSPEGNEILVAREREYQEGFGFLQGAAVDQHLVPRGRVQDLLGVLIDRPELLGIGLDEGTALVIQGDQAEVVGRSEVAVYDPYERFDEEARLFFWLEPGERYDLGARRTLERSASVNDEGPGG